MPFAFPLAATTPANPSVIDLVMQAGPVGKATLLLLLVASIVSWGIILERARSEATGPFVLDHTGNVRKSFETLLKAAKIEGCTPHILRHDPSATRPEPSPASAPVSGGRVG